MDSASENTCRCPIYFGGQDKQLRAGEFHMFGSIMIETENAAEQSRAE